MTAEQLGIPGSARVHISVDRRRGYNRPALCGFVGGALSPLSEVLAKNPAAGLCGRCERSAHRSGQ